MVKAMSVFVLLCVLLVLNTVQGSGKIKIKKVEKCDSKANYSVTVSNLNVTEKNGTIYVSGSLMTKKDLISPIHAKVIAQRYVDYFGVDVWVPVPCISMIGSCHYGDLCHYGIPKNKSCPSKFIEDDVPCRCPILQGNYTLHPEQKIELGPVPKNLFVNLPMYRKSVPLSTPATGIYYVEASAEDKSGLLACYNVYFSYNDEFQENDVLTNDILSDMEPLVRLMP